jgi:hypothetical protein
LCPTYPARSAGAEKSPQTGDDGRRRATTGDDAGGIPITVAAHGVRLCLPSARFTTMPAPGTPYNVVAIER